MSAERVTYASLAGEVVTGAIRNPWNPRASYVYDESSRTVTVTMGARWGRFTSLGEYLEGPLFEADPELCIWVSRPRPKNHHRTSRCHRDDDDGMETQPMGWTERCFKSCATSAHSTNQVMMHCTMMVTAASPASVLGKPKRRIGRSFVS